MALVDQLLSILHQDLHLPLEEVEMVVGEMVL